MAKAEEVDVWSCEAGESGGIAFTDDPKLSFGVSFADSGKGAQEVWVVLGGSEAADGNPEECLGGLQGAAEALSAVEVGLIVNGVNAVGEDSQLICGHGAEADEAVSGCRADGGDCVNERVGDAVEQHSVPAALVCVVNGVDEDWCCGCAGERCGEDAGEEVGGESMAVNDVGAEGLDKGAGEAETAQEALEGFGEVEAEDGQTSLALFVYVLEGDDGDGVSASGHALGERDDLLLSAADAERGEQVENAHESLCEGSETGCDGI